MLLQMTGAGCRPNAIGSTGKGPVHVSQELGPFEPPVTEELSIEWCDDHSFPVGALTLRNAFQQMTEVIGVSPRTIACHLGVIRLFVSQIHAGTSYPPELESARPSHLVELEIPLIAGV